MFYDNYIRLCAEHGEKPTPVAQALGCTSSNVAQWKKGSTPRKPVLEKIAEHFGVPVQDLLFGDDPTPPTLNEQGARQLVIARTADMTEEELEAVAKYIDFIKSQRP